MAGLDNFDLENMEGVMDIYGQRKLKMHSSRVDDLEDWKGSHKPGSQFAKCSLNPQIAGGESDLLAHMVARSWSATVTGGFLVVHLSGHWFEMEVRGVSD